MTAVPAPDAAAALVSTEYGEPDGSQSNKKNIEKIVGEWVDAAQRIMIYLTPLWATAHFFVF